MTIALSFLSFSRGTSHSFFFLIFPLIFCTVFKEAYPFILSIVGFAVIFDLCKDFLFSRLISNIKLVPAAILRLYVFGLLFCFMTSAAVFVLENSLTTYLTIFVLVFCLFAVLNALTYEVLQTVETSSKKDHLFYCVGILVTLGLTLFFYSFEYLRFEMSIFVSFLSCFLAITALALLPIINNTSAFEAQVILSPQKISLAKILAQPELWLKLVTVIMLLFFTIL